MSRVYKGLTSEQRRRNVAMQARDRNGQWVEMGKNASAIVNGKRYSGTLVGHDGTHAYILPPIMNPTHQPQPYKVPLKNISMTKDKGKLPPGATNGRKDGRDKAAEAKRKAEQKAKREAERKALREKQEKERKAKLAQEKKEREAKLAAEKAEREAEKAKDKAKREAEKKKAAAEREKERAARKAKKKAAQAEREAKDRAEQLAREEERERKQEEREAAEDARRKAAEAKRKARQEAKLAAEKADREAEKKARDAEKAAEKAEKEAQDKLDALDKEEEEEFKATQAHAEAYKKKVMKDITDSQTEEERKAAEQFDKDVADAKEHEDELPGYIPKSDHTAAEKAKVLSALDKFFDKLDPNAKDYKDIPHYEIKDEEGNTLFLSPRKESDGKTVIVIRDADKNELDTVEYDTENGTKDELADKILDMYDTKIEDVDFGVPEEEDDEDSSAPKGEQDTLFDMDEAPASTKKEKSSAPKSDDTSAPAEQPELPLDDTPTPTPTGDYEISPETGGVTITEDNLPAAIAKAREDGDTDLLNRLTDLDQLGNVRSTNRDSKYDRLIPAEGSSKISGHNLTAWARRASDEELKEAEKKYADRLSQAQSELDEILKADSPRLADMRRAVSKLRRADRDNQAIKPGAKSVDRKIKAAEKKVQAEADKRKAMREEMFQAAADHRAKRLEAMRSQLDRLGDTKEGQALRDRIDDIDAAIKDNGGSLRGSKVGRAMSNAVKSYTNARRTSAVDIPSLPQRATDRALAGYSNIGAQPARRKPYKVTHSLDKSDLLEYPSDPNRHLKKGDTVHYHYKGWDLVDEDGNKVPNYVEVEVVGVTSVDNGSGEGDIMLLPFEGKPFIKQRVNPDGSITTETLTREDIIERGKDKNSKPYIKANPQNIVDPESGLPFMNPTIDDGKGGRGQSYRNYDHKYADGSDWAPGDLVNFSREKDKGEERRGKIIGLNAANGSFQVALVDENDEPILKDEEKGFSRSNSAHVMSVSTKYTVPASYGGPVPTKKDYQEGNSNVPSLPEGVVRDRNNMPTSRFDGDTAKLNDLRSREYGTRHYSDDVPTVEDVNPLNGKPADSDADTKSSNDVASSEPLDVPEPAQKPDPEPEAQKPETEAQKPEAKRAASQRAAQVRALFETMDKAATKELDNQARSLMDWLNKSSYGPLKNLQVVAPRLGKGFFTNNPAMLRNVVENYKKWADANGGNAKAADEILRHLDQFSSRLTGSKISEIRSGTIKSLLDAIEKAGAGKVVGGKLEVSDLAEAKKVFEKAWSDYSKERSAYLKQANKERATLEAFEVRKSGLDSIKKILEEAPTAPNLEDEE